MSEWFQNDVPDFRGSQFIEQFQPLPGWLADRLLQGDEKVDWVRGPRFNPSWERSITHPGLLIFPLICGAIGLSLGKLIGEGTTGIFLFAAGGIFILTIIVLGLANGYFTRLVVTNRRLFILQGYEICRSWKIDDLPPTLLQYGTRGNAASPGIDLSALKSMLGGSSEQFTDAKTILSLGKQLDRITKSDRDRR